MDQTSSNGPSPWVGAVAAISTASAFAAPMGALTPPTDSLYGIKSLIWLLDSIASHPMTGKIDFLINVYSISPCLIGLPNGSHTIANFEDTVKLGPETSHK